MAKKMKLLNNLYKIAMESKASKRSEYTVLLNASHTIYRAHFPGQPITPGVCIIQMAQELLEVMLSVPLSIAKVQNAKFLTPLSPADSPIKFVFEKTVREDSCVASRIKVESATKIISKISIICEAICPTHR